jgi:hypothetical protein
MSVLNYLLSFGFLSCLFCISRSVFFILILTLSSNKPSVCFKTYFLNLKVFWKQNSRPELFRPFKITSLGFFPHCRTLLILVNKYLLLVCFPKTFELTRFLIFFLISLRPLKMFFVILSHWCSFIFKILRQNSSTN